MKTFRFFLTRIFLRKPFLALVILMLFFAANYIAFTAARTVVSTFEGAREVAHFNIPGTYIANLDPESAVDPNTISDASVRSVYDYLKDGYTFALFTDGYVAGLRNKQDVEVPVAYMNQKYSELNGFVVTAGPGMSFEYDLAASDSIPVLVGKGLAEDYPLNSEISVVDPALNKEVRYVVAGVLEQDPAHSNLYSLDLKRYYNFSVVVPVTDAFIDRADIPFKINGLMDLVVTDTTPSEVEKLGDQIEKTIAVRFNFFSQQENIDFYHEHFQSSMLFLVLVFSLLLIAIVLLAVWSSLAGARVMARELMINHFVGLSYRKYRHLLVAYYSLLASLALSAVFAMVAYSRHADWSSKNAFLMTYGFAGGLMPMDWIALLAAFLVDILLIAVMAQAIVWRVKRIPISAGVLQ